MTLLKVFTPHLFVIVATVSACAIVAGIVRPANPLVVAAALPVSLLIAIGILGLVPDTWIRATPTGDQAADAAIILGFGYQEDGGNLQPGEANAYLWNWFVENRGSAIKTLLAQEGILAAAADQGTPQRPGIHLGRIHKHDPSIYVDTLDTAFCAMERLHETGAQRVLLLAHDLQLQRVAWDFERVGRAACPDCTFIIPEIPNVPFPTRSVHWQTRNPYIYRIVELLVARPRDFMRPVPTACPAPLDSGPPE